MKVRFGGKSYLVIECGSGGNCLFYSLAYVFDEAGVLKDEDGNALRTRCVAAFANWQHDDRRPGWFDELIYEKPDANRIANLLEGDWGDLTCILGVLAGDDRKAGADDATTPYQNVQVNVVYWNDDGTMGTGDPSVKSQLFLGANNHHVTEDVYILWRGGVHYQALITINDDEDDDEATGGDPGRGAEQPPLEIAAKLSEGPISTENNTLNLLSEILEIHQLDVGQGESSIILTRRGGKIVNTVVVDGGKATRGGGTLLRALKRLGVEFIDLVVLTHYDADHIEGLTVLFENWQGTTIGQIWTPTTLFSEEKVREGADNKVLGFANPILKHKGVIVAQSGTKLALFNGHLVILCLCAGRGVGFGANDHSIALQIKFDQFTFYTAGDLESGEEDRLVFSNATHLCAMKCGHHGSNGATSEKFLNKNRPKVALISAGAHKYCHPDDPVIERLCHAPSVQGIFLTSCFYNRAGVNPNYSAEYKKQADELEKLQAETSKAKEDDMPRRKLKVQRKQEYKEPKAASRRLIGTVAGSGTHLGSLVLRVDRCNVQATHHLFHVGYWDGDTSKWAWRPFSCTNLTLPPAPKVTSTLYEDLTSIVELGEQAGPQDADAWKRGVEKNRSVPRFSLPTGMAAQNPKAEVKPLSDDEHAYAMGEGLDEEDEEREGRRKQKVKNRNKKPTKRTGLRRTKMKITMKSPSIRAKIGICKRMRCIGEQVC